MNAKVPWSSASRFRPSNCSTSPGLSLSLPFHPAKDTKSISSRAGVVTAPLLCPRSGFEFSSDRDQPGAAPLASPSVSAFGQDRENSGTETNSVGGQTDWWDAVHL